MKRLPLILSLVLNVVLIVALVGLHRACRRMGFQAVADAAAAEVRLQEHMLAELESGEDFNSVKVKYTLDKEGKAYDTSASMEAYFWPALWAGEPNEVIGPVKGMYRNEFKWRLVKILEKHPGTLPEFEEKMADRVKWHILGKKRQALMEKYQKELLRRYEHKVYYERFKDLKPLDIP